jgi:hypothetical protein
VQTKHSAHLFGAVQFELAQAAPLLDPGKHLLDTTVDIDRLGGAAEASGVLAKCCVTAWRLSMSTWLRSLGWAGWALDLRAISASGSVLERWVLLLSLTLRKSP